MTEKIIIPRNTFWCSNLPTPKQNFLIFFIEKKGIFLAKKTKIVDGLSCTGENLFELTHKTEMSFYLDNVLWSAVDELLTNSIFIPFIEESKFWDETPEGLSVNGKLVIECIPRIEALGGKPINGDWESSISKFFINWPDHMKDHPRTWPYYGVNLFTKQNHTLAFFEVIKTEVFLDFIQRGIPETVPHPKKVVA